MTCIYDQLLKELEGEYKDMKETIEVLGKAPKKVSTRDRAEAVLQEFAEVIQFDELTTENYQRVLDWIRNGLLEAARQHEEKYGAESLNDTLECLADELLEVINEYEEVIADSPVDQAQGDVVRLACFQLLYNKIDGYLCTIHEDDFDPYEYDYDPYYDEDEFDVEEESKLMCEVIDNFLNLDAADIKYIQENGTESIHKLNTNLQDYLAVTLSDIGEDYGYEVEKAVLLNIQAHLGKIVADEEEYTRQLRGTVLGDIPLGSEALTDYLNKVFHNTADYWKRVLAKVVLADIQFRLLNMVDED